jgi:hypothetical protein
MAADGRISISISRDALESDFGLRDHSCSNRMLAHGG